MMVPLAPEAALWRFIPTCVGQMDHSAARWARYSVHPHMRGADLFVYSILHLRCGSSPHAWGRYLQLLRLPVDVRFIPTCVGQMRTTIAALRWITVHPHMRGADVNGYPIRSGCCGSSPHAWGRCCSSWSGCPGVRFIPTCVGQMSHSPPCPQSGAVHPHMRGADLRFFHHALDAERFIPTCVGQIPAVRS